VANEYLAWRATHERSFSADFKAMKSAIARCVLDGGPDPFSGWREAWPSWALAFKEKLLAQEAAKKKEPTRQALHQRERRARARQRKAN
jgi:hypothetical protein